MKNLNGILTPEKKGKKQTKSFLSAATHNAPREMRSDKLDDVKFPVTPEMYEALSSAFRKYKKLYRQNLLFQTGYNTLLIQTALMNYPTDFFLPVQYEDTKNYKHVKLNQFYSEQLFKLKVEWQCSMREAAYRVIRNVIDRGELL